MEAAPPAVELMDDVVADILVRLPPGASKYLIRASAVCKSWRRVLRDPAFLRRYRDLHRAPLLLGFLRYRHGFSGDEDPFDIMTKHTLAVVEGDNLYLWSRPASFNLGRVPAGVIDLKKVLPAHASSFSPVMLGFDEGVERFLLGTDAGAFVVELGSRQVRKVGAGEVYHDAVPYMSVETKDYYGYKSSARTVVRYHSCVHFGEFRSDLNRAGDAKPGCKLIFEGANVRKKRQEEDAAKKPNILIGSVPLEID
ncbi:unnamed protein product [Urochloa humidicola]